jgi:hypothetical protein
MTVRPLRVLGDPVLRTPCDLVLRFDAALDRLVQDLLDTVQALTGSERCASSASAPRLSTASVRGRRCRLDREGFTVWADCEAFLLIMIIQIG